MWAQDTYELGPTNPQVKSVDLHIHLVRFIVSQNHMIVGGLAHPIYMQVTTHYLIDLGSCLTYGVFPTSNNKLEINLGLVSIEISIAIYRQNHDYNSHCPFFFLAYHVIFLKSHNTRHSSLVLVRINMTFHKQHHEFNSQLKLFLAFI